MSKGAIAEWRCFCDKITKILKDPRIDPHAKAILKKDTVPKPDRLINAIFYKCAIVQVIRLVELCL